MEEKRFRLAVVANRPQPYHSAFFRTLAARPEIELTVYYLSDVGVGAAADRDFGRYRSDYPLLDGYRSCFLRNCSPWPDRSRFTGTFHPELFSRLHPRHHDAVLLQGWFGLSVCLGYGLSWLRRLPILFRSEANPADPTRPQWAPLKNIFLPRVLRRCRAFLTIGTRNAEFYRRYGIPEEKLFWTPYAVDNDFFQQQRAAWQPRRADLRRELGLPAEAVVLLYAGRLAPEKGLHNLLQALHRLAAPAVWLLLAGEGRSRKALEEQARSLPVPRVLFLGLQGQKQLARSYVAADIFVLPSHREPWGLVVNEAMNFALPVLVSERAGAVPDLVEAGENGFVFPPGDPDALAGCLRQLVNDPALRRRMGQRSLERILAWSHRESALSTLQALRFALPARGT